MSYWLRCASSVITTMSERSETHRIDLAPLGPELLDQREDVAMVLTQQLPQVLAARRLDVALGRARPASVNSS